MEKKAIIYDLDNTIFPVPSIGEELFKPVFDIIKASGQHYTDFEAIKKEMMKTPFRKVAEKYRMNKELTNKAIAIQEDIEFTKPIATFKDYHLIKEIPGTRFLVTTGFKKMQESKVRLLGIKDDFAEVHVVDPTIAGKKDVFADIMRRFNYRPEEVLVVGDDPESELKAASDLGIETVLYSPAGEETDNDVTYIIKNYKELKDMFL